MLVSGPRYSLGRQRWILPRSHCLFHTVHAANIPPADLQNVLELKIGEWSPYAHTGRYVSRTGDLVNIWIWDQEKYRQQAEQIDALKAEVIPESLLRKPESDNIVCLYAAHIGYEGQIWEDGMLIASHWWAEIPGSEQWVHFQLRNDRAPQDVPEATATETLRQMPWGRKHNSLQSNLQNHEYTLVKAVAVLLFLSFVWYGATTVKISRAIDTLQKQISETEQQVNPILSSRATVYTYLDKIRQLRGVTLYPPQLLIVEQVITVLPKTKIQKWAYRHGSLTVLLKGDNLDPHTLIQALEAQGLYESVTAQRGKKQGQLEIRLQVSKMGTVQ